MKVSDSGLGIKIFLALLFFYTASVAVNWLWSKIKLKIDKK